RLLETYNSLTDKHLVGYFSNARIRRHLQKSGLISRSGRIIPEREYRLNAMRRDHQRHAQECLADAIFRKVLDMERHRQLGRKNKLGCTGGKDRMQPDKRQTRLLLDSVPQRQKLLFFQLDQIRESLEEIIHVHCPHPPLAPRNHHGFCPLVAAEEACCSQCTLPGLGVDCCVGRCAHPHRIRETFSSK
ncbi:ERIC3 protein, partial [Cercotrichas coryphoeus]|nr:ERIC3 protein [Cercotrichas coryphoeus]